MRPFAKQRISCGLGALLGLAACGRGGFEKTCIDDAWEPNDTQAQAAPIALSGGTLSDAAGRLCPRDHDWLRFDVAAGSTVRVRLTYPVANAVIGLELLGPQGDAFVTSIPIWSSSGVALEARATATGTHFLHIYGRSTDTAVSYDLEVATAAAVGNVYFVAADGDDAGPGTEDAPWQTWPHALAALTAAGDTLIARDGTWTNRPACTGLAEPCLASATLPALVCAAGGPGTATAPVTIVAEHERRVLLDSDGSKPSLRVEGCTGVEVVGFWARSDDLDVPTADSNVVVYLSTGINLRRLLVNRNNRFGNAHLLEISTSTGVVVEETELYDFHRVGALAWVSTDVTMRRSYAHSQGRPDIAGGGVSGYPDGGDADFQCASDSRCTVEDVVGIASGYGVALGTALSGTRATGAIAIDNLYNFTASGAGITFADIVSIGAVDVGSYCRDVTGSTTTNATFVGGLHGLAADHSVGNPLPASPSIQVANVLSLGNEMYGIEIDPAVYGANGAAEFSDAYGNGTDFMPAEPIDDGAGAFQWSMSVEPTGIGLGEGECVAYVPATSNMHAAGRGGADIGANVIVRHEGGAPTDEKLWNQLNGQFPCGAIVAGVNDEPASACRSLPERLHIGTHGCPIP